MGHLAKDCRMMLPVAKNDNFPAGLNFKKLVLWMSLFRSRAPCFQGNYHITNPNKHFFPKCMRYQKDIISMKPAHGRSPKLQFLQFFGSLRPSDSSVLLWYCHAFCSIFSGTWVCLMGQHLRRPGAGVGVIKKPPAIVGLTPVGWSQLGLSVWWGCLFVGFCLR